jgi:hypothetical protein
MAKTIDWISIKNEYLNTGISQRKLAEKYGVSFDTLKDKANKERWYEDKKKQHNKITTRTQQKTAEKIVAAEVDRVTNLLNLTDTAQEQIGIAFGQLCTYVDMFGNVTNTDVVDVGRLKKLVSSLKDIKDILRDDKQDKNADVMAKLDEVIGEVDKLAE